MWNRQRSAKYGNKRVEKAGLSFGSKLESSVHDFLLLWEKSGEIKIEKLQDSVYLTKARIQYIADFKISYPASGEIAWCEAKGMETPVFSIKRRLWKWYGPGALLIFKGSWKKPILVETIIPERQDDGV